MGTFATPFDVQASWVSTTPLPDDTAIQVWISRAERLIRRRVPDIDNRVERDNLYRETVVDVVVDLVSGVLRNPDQIRSIQENNGPTSGGITFSGDSPGALILSTDHLRALGVLGRERRARTVETWH